MPLREAGSTSSATEAAPFKPSNEKPSKVGIVSRFRPWVLSHRSRRAILRRSFELHRIWWVLV